MSYKNEIGIACEAEAFEKILDAVKENDLTPYSISKNSKDEYLFFWGNTEWTRKSDYRINNIESVLDTLDRNTSEGFGYCMIRIGEEITDIQVRRNTFRIEEPLTRKIKKDGFDMEVTYEPQQAIDMEED